MKDCISLQEAAAPAEGAAAPNPIPAGPSGRALTGKIARLPHAVREALNERLREGLPAAEILDWLNALPVVRDILQKRFDGSPISKINLCRWRHGGYLGWVEHQRIEKVLSIMRAASGKIGQDQRDAMTEHFALVVKARMEGQLARFDELPEGPAKSAAYKELVWSLALLQRGEFYAGKLRLERDKLPVRKTSLEAPMCDQEEQENLRKTFGLGGPHWNNVTKHWEGEGADEMREYEEVERKVREELRRRKEERSKTEK